MTSFKYFLFSNKITIDNIPSTGHYYRQTFYVRYYHRHELASVIEISTSILLCKCCDISIISNKYRII